MNSALSETPVNLTGQVALVTGGGRGLGRAFALALAGAGAQVAVTARTAAQLAETVQLIERAGGCGPGDSCGGCHSSLAPSGLVALSSESIRWDNL